MGDWQRCQLLNWPDWISLGMDDTKSGDLAAAEELYGRKWFWPILLRLDEFEGRLLGIFPFMGPVLSDDWPEWSFRCLGDVAMQDAAFNGCCDPQKLDSRAVGRIVGSKMALCEAAVALHAILQGFTGEQITEAMETAKRLLPVEIAAEIHAEAVQEWISGWLELGQRFAGELGPEMQEIKRFAASVADEEGGTEELDYLQGFTQGKRFLEHMRERAKPARKKRQRDSMVRSCVFVFAILRGAEIDETKRDRSWPELHQEFLRTFFYQVQIDEETFKKALGRKGLNKVGKAGRPVPVNRDAAD